MVAVARPRQGVTSATDIDADFLATAVRRDGFSFVAAPVMRAMLERDGPLGDWDSFAASWDHLSPDPYLAKLGRQRRRRHAVYSGTARGPLHREPHQPHFQSTAYNALQGDIERWFDPISPAIGDSPLLHRILEFGRDFFGRLAPDATSWRMELHQFRIEASANVAGEPTPEGVHRDGVDYVLVLMIDRHNIASGATTIRNANGRELGSFTLTVPLDAALVDDARVYHGVTSVTPLDPAQPAHRDVLVLTMQAVK